MENKVDKIYLVWGNDYIRRKFVVGTLEKENGYKFYYSHHILDAIKEGFEPLIGCFQLLLVGFQTSREKICRRF